MLPRASSHSTPRSSTEQPVVLNQRSAAVDRAKVSAIGAAHTIPNSQGTTEQGTFLEHRETVFTANLKNLL